MARNIRSNSFGVRSDTWSKEICFFPKSKLEQYKFDKRISCYLIGKKIAHGLYATVHEGMHIVTGEKVSGIVVRQISHNYIFLQLQACNIDNVYSVALNIVRSSYETLYHIATLI